MTGVIEAMLGLGDNYFDHTQCAVQEGRVVGVKVGFPVSEKAQINQNSGKDFARAMGFLRFLARMPLFMRMDKMMPAVENEAAIRFYERNGFERVDEGSMTHKGRELSQVLMRRA